MLDSMIERPSVLQGLIGFFVKLKWQDVHFSAIGEKTIYHRVTETPGTVEDDDLLNGHLNRRDTGIDRM